MADKKPLKTVGGALVEFGASDTVGIANGGTGQPTQQAAINSLTNAMAASAGDILQVVGGNAVLASKRNVRGTVWLSETGGAWSDEIATNAVYAHPSVNSALVYPDTSDLIVGDKVTIAGLGAAVAKTTDDVGVYSLSYGTAKTPVATSGGHFGLQLTGGGALSEQFGYSTYPALGTQNFLLSIILTKTDTESRHFFDMRPGVNGSYLAGALSSDGKVILGINNGLLGETAPGVFSVNQLFRVDILRIGDVFNIIVNGTKLASPSYSVSLLAGAGLIFGINPFTTSLTFGGVFEAIRMAKVTTETEANVLAIISSEITNNPQYLPTLTTGLITTDVLANFETQGGNDVKQIDEWSGSAWVDKTATYSAAAGLNNQRIAIYKRSATAPALPSATATFNFETGAITGLNNGWAVAIPTNDGNPLYISDVYKSTADLTVDILSTEWAAAVILVQNGAVGADGTVISNYTWSGKPAANNSGNYIRVSDVGVNGSLWRDDGAWGLLSRAVLVDYVIPMIVTDTGVFGDNGALTGVTKNNLTGIENAYVYCPANAIYSGSAAGFYYAVFSSNSAATIYNNTITPGTTAPVIPESPTGFICTGGGEFTNSGEISLAKITIPAVLITDKTAISVEAFMSGACSVKQNAVEIYGMGYANKGVSKTKYIKNGNKTKYFNEYAYSGLTDSNNYLTEIDGLTDVDMSAAFDLTVTATGHASYSRVLAGFKVFIEPR